MAFISTFNKLLRLALLLLFIFSVINYCVPSVALPLPAPIENRELIFTPTNSELELQLNNPTGLIHDWVRVSRAAPRTFFNILARRLAELSASKSTTVNTITPVITSLPASTSTLETVVTVTSAAAGRVVVRLICLSCALAIFITYRC